MAQPASSHDSGSTERVLRTALELFSQRGYRATSIRDISNASGVSIGNIYHHFGGKEAIYQRLIDQYWEVLLDPELPLNKVFYEKTFPDDLEEMAAAIEQVVAAYPQHILLIFIDVIEFRGEHIRTFYESMAERFRGAYAKSFEEQRREGRLGEVNPLVAVMAATRWLFYYWTVEKCFGVPMHFGMDAEQAVDEFIRIVRYGVLPREGGIPPAATGEDSDEREEASR